MQRWSGKSASRFIPVIALVLGTFIQFVPAKTEAIFTNAYLRLDRMKINTATGGSVCAKTSTSGTENKVVVTFPSTYTVNSTAANWVVDSTDIPTGSTFWPGMTTGSTTASSVSGQIVTFPSGDISSTSTLYCFHFSDTSTLTTASAAASSQQASVETQTSGSAPIDHTDIALANINDDQIVVSAVVPPTFVFTLSGNTDGFGGNLDPTLVKSSTGNRTVTVTTNAKTGYIVWVKDSQAGLRSTSAAYTIPTSGTVDGTPATLSAGTEGYVLDVDLTTNASGGCNPAVDAEYDGATTSAGGALSSTAFAQAAVCNTPTPATANGDVFTLIERVAISGATPAGADYSDIITVIGAGNF